MINDARGYGFQIGKRTVPAGGLNSAIPWTMAPSSASDAERIRSLSFPKSAHCSLVNLRPGRAKNGFRARIFKHSQLYESLKVAGWCTFFKGHRAFVYSESRVSTSAPRTSAKKCKHCSRTDGATVIHGKGQRESPKEVVYGDPVGYLTSRRM